MNKKILFFPKAGLENPYQFLTIKGLTEDGFDCKTITHYKLFTVLTNVLKNKDRILYFDWIHMFYLGENFFFTALKSITFIFEIIVVKLLGYKIYSTCHNLYPHKSGKTFLNKFIRTIFYNLCTKIRVFDNQSKNDVCSEFFIPNNKVVVILEGNYIEYYSKVENKELDISIKNNKITLGFVGTIKPYKGILPLLKWFKNLDQNKFQLIIVGKCSEKNYTEEIDSLIQNTKNITFENTFIENNKLEFWFNKIDIICLPFLNIQNSGTVIMAMGFKKPIISVNTGAIAFRLKKQNHLLFTHSLNEIDEVLNNITQKEIIKIGEENFVEAQKYNWVDIKSLFV